MPKLRDLFMQARKTQNGGSIGFLGKSATESKAHAAALVVSLPTIAATSAEAVLKAGADGVLFSWDGKKDAQKETLKQEITTLRTSKGNEQAVIGVSLTGGWEQVDRDTLAQLKDWGIQYIILPFNAPARLLALEEKDIEKVVTIPIRSNELFPLFIRTITAFDDIAAVMLDFGLTREMGTLTIEDVLHYRAVREAAHFPAFLQINNDLDENEAYTITTLGVQAVVLAASGDQDATCEHVKTVRKLLEVVHREERDTPMLP